MDVGGQRQLCYSVVKFKTWNVVIQSEVGDSMKQ